MRFHKPNIRITDKDLEKFKEIADSGWVCNGKYTQKLESEFGCYALACSSATQGMIIALRAMGIKNQKIAIPAFTWPSTEYAVRCSENEPVFWDIDKDTWLMEPNGFYPTNSVLNIPVDIFGSQAEVDENTIMVDAAHGYGLPKLGKRAPAEVVSLSFTKPITAMQGGIIILQDENTYNVAKELRDLSSKMCEFNAIVALNAIESYEGEKKEASIWLYRRMLSIDYQEQQTNVTNNSVYAIALKDKETRDRIAQEFRENDVEAKIYYEPLAKGMPNTDDLYDRIIALPIYNPNLVPFICELINRSAV